MLLTSGFVDIHTHYDSQATWDGELEPSTPHGVTTLMMGNCGVDFAPAKPDEHDFLIDLTEGFLDVPGAVTGKRSPITSTYSSDGNMSQTSAP